MMDIRLFRQATGLGQFLLQMEMITMPLQIQLRTWLLGVVVYFHLVMNGLGLVSTSDTLRCTLIKMARR